MCCYFKGANTDKKKSAKGLLKIKRVGGELTLFDNMCVEEKAQGC